MPVSTFTVTNSVLINIVPHVGCECAESTCEPSLEVKVSWVHHFFSIAVVYWFLYSWSVSIVVIASLSTSTNDLGHVLTLK